MLLSIILGVADGDNFAQHPHDGYICWVTAFTTHYFIINLMLLGMICIRIVI